MGNPELSQQKSYYKHLINDKLLLSGIIAIIVSALIFFAMIAFETSYDTGMITFCINYAITVCYSFAVLTGGFSFHKWSSSNFKLNHTIVILLLWFISAFSLNREMNVFDKSPDWLSAYLILSCIALIATTRQDKLPKYLSHFTVFVLGAAFILFLYYAIYLIPFYGIGILAAIFLGLSLHVFIPLLLALYTLIVVKRKIWSKAGLKYSFMAGITLPLAICTWFTLKWSETNHSIETITNHNTLKQSNLPAWAVIGQQLPKSIVTEKMMKAGLVYTTPTENGNWFWGDFGNSFDEPKKHDPLVVIATVLAGRPALQEKDRIKILKAMYDSRHPAQDRLWSAENLETSSVVTNIKVYPEYRLAYTEKTLTIKNNSQRKWNNDEEAIYTFHLSEGSVVSSLSLWINGIEEKARLTTKGKADTAYRSVVGIERRDPSVIHWQEGNTVIVRVFPCNNKENRQFRIGITSPLKKNAKTLVYENPYFNGPSCQNALETIQLAFSIKPTNLKSDSEFPNASLVDRNYKDKWSISFDNVSLSTNGFSFNGSGYQLAEAKTTNTFFKPNTIYLDINDSWTLKDLNAIRPYIKQYRVYSFTDKMIHITEENADSVFKDLNKLNYSLFPFFEIKDPKNVLVITKGDAVSPNLNDLDGSIFQKRISSQFAKSAPLHLYNLATENNAYIKTLKEFGVFKYDEGGMDQLLNHLRNHTFLEYRASNDALNIAVSAVSIKKVPDSTLTGAPDHLLRLFAYNDILRKVGKTYFENEYINDDLLHTASEAYIVSPMSSLIVLETQNDYKRFNIEQSKNSLQNASLNSSGAAPEPHEWLLILLTASVCFYYLYKSKYLKNFRFTS